MTPLLWRAGLRYHLRQPLQLALAILGIALGVAVVVAVDIASGSARRGFELSTNLVAGRATHHISAAAGGVPEDIYGRLRTELGLRDSAPVIEALARLPAADGLPVRLLGLDIFAESGFRRSLTAGRSPGSDWGGFLMTEGAALVSGALAERLEIQTGQSLEVPVGPGVSRLQVLGILDGDGRIARESLLVVDIATAQELLGMQGSLSRIDLALPDEATAEALAAWLPAGLSLDRSEVRNRASEKLTEAFELNLTAMSLLALVVGALLIYNTMSFSVVRRRPLLGRLRALGVQRRELRGLILGEAALLGLLGATLGVILGIWLGTGLMRLVTRTINDLYFTSTVLDVPIRGGTLSEGLLLGLAATLVAAWQPAREAAMAPPAAVLRRSDLELRIRRRLPLLAGLGCLVLLGTGVWLKLGPTTLTAGFAGLFLLMSGCALLAAPGVALLAALLHSLAERHLGMLGRMASRDVGRHLSRTGVAATALMVAVATTVGISVMIESFRGSVSVWLEQILNADLYVAPAAVDSGDRNAVLLSDTVATLAGLPQVDQISLYRRTRVAYRDRRVEVIGAQLAPRSRPGYHLLSSEAEAAWRDFDQGGIMISEPLAYHFGLQPGDELELTTPSSPRSFRIAGIFHDYGSEHGRILLRLRDYQTLWRDAQISSAALFVVPGTDLDIAAAAAAAAGGPTQSLLVSPSAELRRTSLRVFDRTFTITGVLRSLAVLIAFVGIFSALMALLLERSREFALLRATGLTGVELAKLLTLQTGLMGLAAGVMAIPTGLLMAAVLVGVIQQRAFGWSMQFSVPAETLFQAILIAGTAALLAVCYPAWRLARREPAQDLREE